MVALALGAVTTFLVSSSAAKHLRATVAEYDCDADGVRVEIATDRTLGEFTQIQVKKFTGPPRLHTVMTFTVSGKTNAVRIRLPTKTKQWCIIHKVTRPSIWSPISGALWQGANHCAIPCIASLSERLWEKVRDRTGPVQIYRSDVFDVPEIAVDSAHNQDLQAAPR